MRTIVQSGANVVICRKGIDDRIQHALANAGILAIRRVPLRELETISRATGAMIAPEPSSEGLGEAERLVVDDRIRITGTKHESSTLLLCGITPHVAEELERAAEDARGVVAAATRSGKVVPGAITIETLLSELDGPLGRAFERLATRVISNAGFEKLPKRGRGLDARTGEEVDAIAAGIIEPIDVKLDAISAAYEIARIILRVETIVTLPDPRRNGTAGTALSP